MDRKHDAHSSLPFYSRWLMRLLLSRHDYSWMMDDLDELYRHKVDHDGKAAANTWLKQQVMAYSGRSLFELLRPGPNMNTNISVARENLNLFEVVRQFIRDMRISTRNLARTPVMAITIVITVGLGIAATTVMFAVVNGVMLKPLPYSHSQDLVRIYTDAPPNKWNLSVADLLALEEQQTQFTQIAAYTPIAMTYVGAENAERLQAMRVSWGVFSLLGTAPALGRVFTKSDASADNGQLVVISHNFWMNQLGGSAAVIGSTLNLDGEEYLVVGVLPRSTGPLEIGKSVFPLQRFETPPRKGPFFLKVLGRLAPHATPAMALAELQTINKRIFPIWQSSYQDESSSWGMMPLKDHVIGDISRTLKFVMAALAFVLLIACTNAANLLVARAAHRQRELAVRSALGASRGRIFQHLLSESIALALAACILGLALAIAGIKFITTLGAIVLPRIAEITLLGDPLIFMFGVTVISLLVFGLVPALHAANVDVEGALRSGGRTTTEAASQRRLRKILVVLQFAVATPLLVASGLLLVSLDKLNSVDPGINTANVLTAAVILPATAYSDPVRAQAFWDEAAARVAALPGVEQVAYSDSRPPVFAGDFNNFDLEQYPTPSGQAQPVVPWVAVTKGYFRLFDIALQRGRVLENRDGEQDAQPVVVVDQAWADRFFPNENPLGKRFHNGGCTSCPLTTVVGVVSTVKYTGLDHPDEGTIYQASSVGNRFRFFMIRTAPDAPSILPAVRNIVRELDPALPLAGVATLDDLVANSLSLKRYVSAMVTGFASLALLLSMIGIYGVMAYFVEQHRKDIGVRIALGAATSNVLGWVMKQGMLVVTLGLFTGLLIAGITAGFMDSLLFEINATDPRIFSLVILLMLGVAAIACFIPAHGATRVDPVQTLRSE